MIQDKYICFSEEIENIYNKELRVLAKDLINGLPDYFFEIPASSSGKYHPAYALGEGGLIRHTRAAIKIAVSLLSLEQNKELKQYSDHIIIALLVHDGFKQGIEQQAKFQYMAALMNTANAILGAWTSSMSLPAPASFVLAGIQTAAAAAMGAIQIAQIQKSAQQAGANLSSSSASVSNSGISSITAPVQYTQDVNAAYIGKQISNSKMYVSVSEIDRVSNRVNVAESESKY